MAKISNKFIKEASKISKQVARNIELSKSNPDFVNALNSNSVSLIEYMIVRFENPANHKKLIEKLMSLVIKYDIDFSELYEILTTDFLNTYHQILLNRPDDFLKYILSSKYRDTNNNNMDSSQDEIIYNLSKIAIERGANVNQQILGGKFAKTLLEYAETYLNNRIAALLKENGATCGFASDSEAQYIAKYPLIQEFMNSSVIEQSRISDKNLHSSKGYINNIPYLVHHIWLTHPLSPREIREEDLDNLVSTKKTLGGNLSKWSHIVWTNDKGLLPKSTKFLEENGIEVRNIEDYQQEISLFEPIMQLVDKKLWGMASDSLRYVIVQKFGGIYSDINFKFKRSIEEDLYKFDFIAQDFNNCIFAAKPNHPILNGLLEIMKEHFYNVPNYLINIPEKYVFEKTTFFGLLPFSTSIIEHYNQDGNSDIVYSMTARDKYDNELLINNHQYKSVSNTCLPCGSLLSFGGAKDYSSDIMIGEDSKTSTFTWMES